MPNAKGEKNIEDAGKSKALDKKPILNEAQKAHIKRMEAAEK